MFYAKGVGDRYTDKDLHMSETYDAVAWFQLIDAPCHSLGLCYRTVVA